MKLKLDHKQNETNDVVSFFFTPEEPLEYKAGQYLVYEFPHSNPDDRGIERFFTNSAAPHEGQVRITTRFAGDTGSTFKAKLFQLQPGAEIEAKRVGGSFTVEDPTQDYVFIAGGIGITPFRSILVDLDHHQQPINVNLLYSNRDDDFVFKSEFDELAARNSNLKIQYFMDPQPIDEAAIRNAVPDITKSIFMISGPEPMVKHFNDLLVQMGVPPEHIKRDSFPGYTWPNI